MAGRLLKDKGIDEYLKLSKNFNQQNVTFFLAGDLDEGNPNSLTQEELRRYKKNKSLNYLGYIDLQKELQNMTYYYLYLIMKDFLEYYLKQCMLDCLL